MDRRAEAGAGVRLTSPFCPFCLLIVLDLETPRRMCANWDNFLSCGKQSYSYSTSLRSKMLYVLCGLVETLG